MDININLQQVFASLGPNAAFRLINGAKPTSGYFLNKLLPERNFFTYTINGGDIIIRATMAGLVGMDSPYPEGGSMSISTFMENTAKVANRVRLKEATMRELQQLYFFLRASNASTGVTNEQLRNVLLNFYETLVTQAHIDTFEFLRGRALMTGEIDWTYNKIPLKVDYQVPAPNKFAARTGNDGYGGTTSKFWTDWQAALKLLNGRMAYFVCHDNTATTIIYNDANKADLIDEEEIDPWLKVYTIRRVKGSTERPDPDKRGTAKIYAYRGEASIIDLNNPTETIPVQFIQNGEWAMVGVPTQKTFTVGDGSQTTPDREFGYTHLGPTVEGGARPGRWGDTRVPDETPWAFEGRGVTNGLPVILEPKLLVNGKTELPA